MRTIRDLLSLAQIVPDSEARHISVRRSPIPEYMRRKAYKRHRLAPSTKYADNGMYEMTGRGSNIALC